MLDKSLMNFPSDNQSPGPQVSTQRIEDQIIDWTPVGPRSADAASALQQILSRLTKTDRKDITRHTSINKQTNFGKLMRVLMPAENDFSFEIQTICQLLP